MLCRECKKNVATIHYKSSKNGNVNETFLCSECAAKLGITDGFSSMLEQVEQVNDIYEINSGALFDGLFGSMLNGTSSGKATEKSVCPVCGMRFSEFLNGSKLGCSKCYEVFEASLLSTVRRIHGNVEHCGKIPSGVSFVNKKTENEIKKYSDMLQKAIEQQEYEKAAEYRDKIRELEKSIKDNDEKEEK